MKQLLFSFFKPEKENAYHWSDFSTDEYEYVIKRISEMYRGLSHIKSEEWTRKSLSSIPNMFLGIDKFSITYEITFIGNDILAWLGDHKLKNDNNS